jgi:hypothetical protein
MSPSRIEAAPRPVLLAGLLMRRFEPYFGRCRYFGRLPVQVFAAPGLEQVTWPICQTGGLGAGDLDYLLSSRAFKQVSWSDPLSPGLGIQVT